MVFALQIPLDGSDHQDNHLTGVVDKKGASKIPYPLNKEVLRLSQIYRMNMTELSVVSEHFDVDSAYQQLTHLLLWQVPL
jgi:hypothetical protein